jgi:nickel-dependent lactate racemase
MYVMTVTKQHDIDSDSVIHGLFIGRERAAFEAAVELSQKMNLILLDRPIKKAVVYLDAEEFQSSWLCNKAVYRTRMAMADGGELIILAPGMKKFGEDSENDRLIRKYGYIGRERMLELVKTEQDLIDNLSVAAHIIHGSSDGRFDIVYAVDKMSRHGIEGVNYKYMSYHEAAEKYDICQLTDGYNTLPNGEEIFFISNPALGLWALQENFK